MALAEAELTPPQAPTPPEESKLLLPSLEVRNFRCFEHLVVERLGRVNLITGRNNVGKSSLLEAAYLYARSGAALPLWEVLSARDEFETTRLDPDPGPTWGMSADAAAPVYPVTVKHLFHGRRDFGDLPPEIVIGPRSDADRALKLLARYYRVFLQDDGTGLKSYHFQLIAPNELRTAVDASPYLVVKVGASSPAHYSLDQLSDRSSSLLRMGLLAQDKHGVFVRSSGVTANNRLARLWDNVNLSPLEDGVLECLRVIEPATERVGTRIDPEMPTGRIPIIKLQGQDTPIPLRTMGEGVVRAFGIAVALVNASAGYLLIDEVENGLHYSVHADVWRVIFRLAQRLNVQVFATTHSWDCIEGFQRAAADSEEEGVLIRLLNHQGKLIATCFDEVDLAVITRDQLEVR